MKVSPDFMGPWQYSHGLMSRKAYDHNVKAWIAPATVKPNTNACKARNCRCCKSLNSDNFFSSSTTGTRFVFNHEGWFSCKSSHIIYLITCEKCDSQYVGQSKQALHQRLNSHRHSIVKNKLNTYLCQHFNSMGHSFNDVRIQIIDSIDSSIFEKEEAALLLNQLEDFYIKTLNTLYPLGLNDRIYGGGCISRDSALNSHFYMHSINRDKRSHGIRKSGRKKRFFSDKEDQLLLCKLDRYFQERNFIKFYQTLNSTSKRQLKNLFDLIIKRDNLFSRIFLAFFKRKFENGKIDRPVVEKASIVIDFNSSNMKHINLYSILCSSFSRRLIPESIRSKYPPRIYFKLNDPIFLKFSNYSTFLKSLTVDEIRDILGRDCVCNCYTDFICQEYGHVITGDLNFVKDDFLKSLMLKGAKFRVDKWLPWCEVLRNLEDNINRHASCLAKKYSIPFEEFTPWLEVIIGKLRNKVAFLKKKVPFSYNNFLSKSNIARNFDSFIVTVVDKASNNFAIICKKLYVMILLKELGFDLSDLSPIGNVTYSATTLREQDIVTDHKRMLYKKFGIRISKEDLCLPRIFWVPKLHKNPIKCRFIAGARHSSTRSLSKIVNKGLAVIKKHFMTYCEAIRKTTGFNHFWSINSTSDFLEKIRDNTVHSIQVYDFSTLYTSLGQEIVIENVFALLGIIFNSTNRKFLCIGKHNSFLSQIQYSGYKCFDLKQFKDAIDFVVKEV